MCVLFVPYFEPLCLISIRYSLCVDPTGGSVAPIPCGNATVYCPLGSSWPLLTSPGNYSSGGTNTSTYYAFTVCPAGYFCINGIQSACPAGTFSSTIGASQASFCQQCTAGYYCGNASTAGVQCGGDGVYCPAGSHSPVTVDIGYYSTGTPGLRSNETICPLGQYCVGGVNASCPAGAFGGVMGLNSSACSGPCSAGASLLM